MFDTHSVPIEYPAVTNPATTPVTSQPSSPRPTTLVKMAPGSSSRHPMFSVLVRVDNQTPVNVKVDSIGKLTGQHDYQIWSASMNIVLKRIKPYEVVVDGVSPADDADQTENDAFEDLKHSASTIFIQVVTQDILETIVELENPHLMWTWLFTEYYRASAFAHVSQIINLVSVPSLYSGTDLQGLISKCDSQWLHLTKLSKASSDAYQTIFATCLNEDKAKRDVVLDFLVKHKKHVIDTLTTKDSLLYADFKQELMDIAISEFEDNSALWVSEPSGNSYSSSCSSSSSNSCTWFKEHNPGKSEGHTLNECFRLEKMNKEKKEKKTRIGPRKQMSPRKRVKSETHPSSLTRPVPNT